MAEWQPIETLDDEPKDRLGYGPLVLLASKDGSMMVGMLSPRGDFDDGDFRSFETWPTHWMPLPEPPNDRQ